MTKWRWTSGRVALVLVLLGYVVSAWWLFVRKSAAEPDGRVKVRLAHWQIEYGPPDGIEAVIKRYEELNPNVDVEQVLVPGPRLLPMATHEPRRRHGHGHHRIRQFHARHAGCAGAVLRVDDRRPG
jgi:ABC-type glycerol-3-phosphate transport system substrate-binding protein